MKKNKANTANKTRTPEIDKWLESLREKGVGIRILLHDSDAMPYRLIRFVLLEKGEGIVWMMPKASEQGEALLKCCECDSSARFREIVSQYLYEKGKELALECDKHYDASSREISNVDIEAQSIIGQQRHCDALFEALTGRRFLDEFCVEMMKCYSYGKELCETRNEYVDWFKRTHGFPYRFSYLNDEKIEKSVQKAADCLGIGDDSFKHPIQFSK